LLVGIEEGIDKRLASKTLMSRWSAFQASRSAVALSIACGGRMPGE